MKIVIADDSAPLRERLVEMLSHIQEIEVVEQAQDVREALDSVRTLQPDLLLLELHMPGGSGFDVLREVKRSYASIVAIVLTNHPYPQYRQRCAELGADHFLCKSGGLEPLIEILRAAGRSEGNIHE